MRKPFIWAFLANVALTVLAIFILPGHVAIHFGIGGYPDSWASRGFFLLIFLALEVPLFLLFLYVPSLILKCPPKIVSLPNRDYWLAEENRHLAGAKLSGLMSEFGFVLFAFLLGMGLLTVYANLLDPVRLNERVFLALFIAFMVYTIYWCIKIFAAFKMPSKQ